MDSPDFALLADTSDQLREAVQALVAGLIRDGFTDREARAIVAGLFSLHTQNDKGEENR
jgi:hypothetical protein